jgi:hypothetical protein
MLNERETLCYLLDRGLIGSDVVVRAGVRIEDASRRNRNFKIICASGASYLVKQGVGTPGPDTIAHEGAVYSYLQANGDAPYLPTCFGYDEEKKILILELMHGAQDFRDYHTRRGIFGPAIAGSLGRLLGLLHGNNGVDNLRRESAPFLAEEPPWILSIARPPSGVMREIGDANLTLVRAIQQSSEMPALLDTLRQGWRTEALIHHDIKWDNCIVYSGRAGGKAKHLKIIDWEGASIGDPCWDAGSVFSNYLSFWLFSNPDLGDGAPEQFLESARYPLESMHGAVRTFWRTYVKTMGLRPATSHEWLVRATQYAAARLIQTGYEYLAVTPRFTRAIAFLLQLSANVMKRPQEASAQLLGIHLEPIPIR